MENQKVTALPNDLCPAFIEWCIRGGHNIKIKKDRVQLRKNGKVGEIICMHDSVNPKHPMNQYMTERFYLFCQQWLKYGKSFVEELDTSMMSKYMDVVKRSNLAKVA